MSEQIDNYSVGERLELIHMFNDPRPIESGAKGTIRHIGGGVLNVLWDNGRDLGVVVGVDIFIKIK